MKPQYSVSILLSLSVFALAGCGGRPAEFQPNAKIDANTPDPGGSPPANSSTTPAPGPPPAAPTTPSSQPAAAPPASALPTPPSGAAVFNQIQNSTDHWGSCSVCAQGTNETTNFWMAPHQGSPSMTGSSRQFYVGGPKWSNALFWKTFYDHTNTTHFLWDFYVYWDPTSMANIWTAEFDFWQSVGGKEFMIGNQCNFGDGYWDIWDSKANKWLHSDVRCSRLEPKKWHRFQIYMERLGNEHYRYDLLVIDGKTYNMNRTFDPNPTSWPNTMGVQWQLDQSSAGVDVHEWVDNVKLTVW